MEKKLALYSYLFLLFSHHVLGVDEVRMRLITASRVPTKAEVAPYREAYVAHDYEVHSTFSGFERGERVRVLHHCLKGGREQVCPEESNVGQTFLFRLDRKEKHERALKSQYLRDDLDFDPDVSYFVDVSRGELVSLDQFDYGSSLSDKIVELALLWDKLEVVALGDSRTEAALMPSVLAKQGFNLATPSAGVPTMITLGREYALKVPNLKVLVLGLSGRMFSETWSDGAHSTLISSPAFRMDQAKGVGVALLHYRDLGYSGQAGWRGRRAYPYSKRGFLDYGVKQKSNFLPEVPRLIRQAMRKPKLKLVEGRIQSLANFVTEALKKEIYVLVFNHPVHPEFLKAGMADDDGTRLEDQRLLTGRLRTLVDSSRYRFVDVSAWGETRLKDSHFSDPDHLSERGARFLSKELRREIVELVTSG